MKLGRPLARLRLEREQLEQLEAMASSRSLPHGLEACSPALSDCAESSCRTLRRDQDGRRHLGKRPPAFVSEVLTQDTR
jgi:hypothetical protein